MPAFPRSSITSVNATFSLTIPGIFVTPQNLAQFSADDVFGTDPIEPGEFIMGVDGTQSGGIIYQSVKQRIMFMANSPSIDIFDNWYLAQKVANDVFSAFGIVTLPSLNRKFLLNNGGLSMYQPLPDAKRVLQPRTMQLTWQEIVPAQIA